MENDAMWIIRARCEQRGITMSSLARAPRTRFWSQFRQELAAELRRSTCLSWGDISFLLGKKQYRGKRTAQIQKPEL